jgi:hypothetical protein
MMDTLLLRTFQAQAALQCRYVLLAAQDINNGLKNENIEFTFYAIQNLLNASANISKVLWGQAGSRANERKPLRDSVGITDDSPLRAVTMRNNFEHFDERLEKWRTESPDENYIDLNIVAKETYQHFAEIDRFRAFDPTTTYLTFWGQEFNIRKIVDEVRRIAPKLEEEANKSRK